MYKEMVCRGCGTVFDGSGRGGKRFCSPHCRQITCGREYYERHREEWKRPLLDFSCAHCGTAFQSAQKKARFCSRSCKTILGRIEWKAKNPDYQRTFDAQRLAQQVAKNKERRAANPERFRQQHREWSRKRRREQPYGFLIAGARNRAKERGLAFDLTQEWAVARWTGRCELTNLPFICGRPLAESRMFSPTLDRISPARGYTQDNCRFIMFGINAFKGEETDENMYLLAEALLSIREVTRLKMAPR